MPIRPENKHRYPPNWDEIREQILIRAGYQCEKCWKPDRVRVKVGDNGDWYDDLINSWRDCDGHLITPKFTLGPWPIDCNTHQRVIKVVLTVAHLDHIIEHCDPSNLRALCQRCHLTYDIAHHIQQHYMNRRDSLTIDMFENTLWQVSSN